MIWCSEPPEQTGEVDDVAVRGLDDMGQKGFRTVDHAPVVNIHDAFEFFELGGGDCTDERDTNVVVDLIDGSDVAGNRVGIGQDGVALGDVELGGKRRVTVCCEQRRGLGQYFLR